MVAACWPRRWYSCWAVLLVVVYLRTSTSSNWFLQRRGGAGSNKPALDTLLDDEDNAVSRGNLTDGDEGGPSSSRRRRQKLQFLDRIAMVSSRLLEEEPQCNDTPEAGHSLDEITPQSDLTRPGRNIHIVTTAALPWFTGTAVNPLLRAAYLHRYTQSLDGSQNWVTLVIPWLELAEDQEALYSRVFEDEVEQELFIRDWLKNEAGMEDVADELQILFYPARYHAGLGSIFAMGDILRLIETKDVAILEEPEHLSWYRAPGDGWTKSFEYVVGIVHTNYKEYASGHYSGLWTAPALAAMSSAMVRAYCHKVIKLSDTLQTYAPEKETTSNVHGVRRVFLEEGQRRAQANEQFEPDEPRAYFIGKLLWAKGLNILLDLQDYYRQCTGDYFEIDIFGSGPDQKEIKKAFHGRRRRESGDRGLLETTLALEGGTKVVDDGKDGGSTTELSPHPSNARRHTDDLSSLERLRWKTQQQIAKVRAMMGAARDLSLDVWDDEEDLSTLFEAAADSIPSLEELSSKAKRRIARLKESINSVELPSTFSELRRKPIPATFPGRVDHGTLTDSHDIFVNPSVSEVLCTTTAEALAMGKFAIIPVHPSNTFFLRFPNCLAYRNKFEFVANLRWALTHTPEPLSPELEREFTWEAATERLIDASAVTWREVQERERLGTSKLDERIAWLHNELGKGTTGDVLRKILGAGPASHQVKYEMERMRDSDSEDEDEDESEDERVGLTDKFRQSSFAEAFRATIDDLSSFIQ